MLADANKYGYNMRHKILRMDEGLTVDAFAKVRAIMHMREQYSNSIVYHVGKTMCTIRIRYTRMMFLYMLALKHYDEFKPSIHAEILIEMQQIWWGIDNLVRMIEMWAEEEFKNEQANVAQQNKKENQHSDRVRWKVQQDTTKIVLEEEGEEKDKETNKYMNGFDTDFIYR